MGVWVGNFDGSPMEHVSGVTGAAPVLHDIFEHLHARYGTSWYAAPANIVECWINPITGKRLNHLPPGPGPDAMQEKFLAANLPPLESPADYAGGGTLGRVLLGSEYREWFASGDNWLGNRAALAPGRNSLRISFPLPGTTVYLDPDLPFQGRRLFLSAQGSEHLEWQSDSLRISRQDNREIALLTEGRHQITVHDPETGQAAQTWINVLAR